MPWSPSENYQSFLDRQQSGFVRPIVAVCLSIIVTMTLAHQVLQGGNSELFRDLFGVVVFSILFYAADTQRISEKNSHTAVLVVSLIMMLFSIWEEWSLADGQLPHYLQIIFVAAGLIMMKVSCLVGLYLSSLGCYYLYCAVCSPQANLGEVSVTLLIAATIGAGCFAIRQRMLLHQFEQTRSEEEEQAQLREALQRIQDEHEKLHQEKRSCQLQMQEATAILHNLNEQESCLKQELMHSQAMDSIGRLAGGLAHELNNTITVVRGLIELNQDYLRGLVDGPELLAEMKETLSRGGELAGRLVSVSGNINLQKRGVSLGQILRTLRKLVGNHRADYLKVDFDETLSECTVLIDEGAWLQTINNLLVNAWDASPPNSTVELQVCVESQMACFRVKDSGSGIAEENQSKIFEPYFTTKARGSGTGLGLAIAHGVVEKHGGSLTLDKSDGEGSIFCAKVPLVLRVETPNETPTPVSAVDRKMGARVLFVEDEEAILRVAKRHLARLGFDVTATTKPREALALLERERYDVVVSDVVMPELDGPGLISQARETVPDLKVIFVSGYTDDRLRGTGISQSNHAFLRKPYTIPELAKLIDKTICE